MDIYFYNTLTKQKEKFVPLDPNLVRIYSCGPTVYRDVHIGNHRTYLMADFARRVLEYNGYKVKKVQNITDVGHMRRNETNPDAFDPVITAALESGKSPFEITEMYAIKFFEDLHLLNIIDSDVYPRASQNIPEIISIVKELLNKGFAYDSGENIYFDVKKFRDYGRLSGNTLSKMEKLMEAVRVASETDKTDSADFVLWKRVAPDYLMKWDSPWGLGTPGWHIECTAMSTKYLGKHFDIHTGGEDNIFPHHEDEIAQSEAWTSEVFVNYWLHGGHLTVNGEKMARRRGNVYLVNDLIKKGFDPLSFRYLCMTSYYRSKMNFTWESLSGANSALNKLINIVQSDARKPEKEGCVDFEDKFMELVNDDLNFPKALSVVWEMVKSGETNSKIKASLLKFDKVLGLKLDRGNGVSGSVPENILILVKKRAEARATGDFELADKIRREIESKGYVIEDKAAETKVVKKHG